ncbi:hypothetical protein ACC691_38585, partial [Rhizobium johnstonii]|uniref:hypothetical protein n=1 Tax=Rhizobium johnstonii TaxID=3019933 RepID=UPI003F96F2AF
VFGGLLPDCSVTGMAAGLHCLLELPHGVEEHRVEEEAAERGMLFEGLQRYLAAGAPHDRGPAVVLGFGAPPPHRFGETLEIVSASVRAALPR